MICPLCGGAADGYHRSRGREFFLCPLCRYIFVPACQHLPPDEERKRYLEHENSLENEGYVRMFETKLDLLVRHGPAGGTVLDFGCGYEPVLKTLLERRGFEARVYDRFFFPEWQPGRRYDAVISTETFEHLRAPVLEIDRILQTLKPGGYLAIMTRFYPEKGGEPDPAGFANWYYTNDPTHIGFFGSRTLDWIARTRQLEIVYRDGHDFIIYQTSS